jgi:GNAT superfamily N-acetyltransferase
LLSHHGGAMAYLVRPADLVADRGAILDVWRESLPSANADHYRWMYEQNPFGPVATWVLESTEQDAVVGVATVLPRRLTGLARTWRAGVTIDFAVSKGHRTLGPALMLQKAITAACREQQFDLVYGFPIEAAARVQTRAGFTSLGHATEMRKTLRSASALAAGYGRVASLAAPLVDSALRVVENVHVRSAAGNYRLVEATTFDERFDALWARVKDTLPLTIERTSTYLNWRYRQCPHASYRAFVMQSATADDIAGYGVWSFHDGQFTVSDMLAENGACGMRVLTAEMLRLARALRATVVTTRCFGAAATIEAQRSLGFRTGESPRHAVMCVAPNTPSADLLVDRRNWYLLDGDTDV